MSVAKIPASDSIFDVVGLGQCSLDFLGTVSDYPEVDQKAELGDFLVQGGGPVATALVTLSRLGVSAAFAGRVGGDDFGGKIREGLIAEGVDCSALAIDPDGSSQIAFIVVEPRRASRNIFWTRGSARPLLEGEIPRHLIASARVLHLDGLQREASLAAARFARERGVVTVLDGGSWREGTAELLPYIDHLVVSEKFARHISHEPPQALESLLRFGGRAATVTMGEKGSFTLSAGGEFFQGAFPITAVDTTGCGDVFHGGYIFGLLRGWSLQRTVAFAAACAALKTRSVGGRTAIPNLKEAEAFLAGAGLPT
jgi:sulfofructose kinase